MNNIAIFLFIFDEIKLGYNDIIKKQVFSNKNVSNMVAVEKEKGLRLRSATEGFGSAQLPSLSHRRRGEGVNGRKWK